MKLRLLLILVIGLTPTMAFADPISAVDAFVDRASLDGQRVEIDKCQMSAADSSSIICSASGVTLWIETRSASADLVRLALNHCTAYSTTPPECSVSISGVLKDDEVMEMLELLEADLNRPPE